MSRLWCYSARCRTLRIFGNSDWDVIRSVDGAWAAIAALVPIMTSGNTGPENIR
ncbi:MAG TPA: hypothetical protein VGH38_15295 [Bryobacteraceae bacterium]|jgi:hypothetical protein